MDWLLLVGAAVAGGAMVFVVMCLLNIENEQHMTKIEKERKYQEQQLAVLKTRMLLLESRSNVDALPVEAIKSARSAPAQGNSVASRRAFKAPRDPDYLMAVEASILPTLDQQYAALFQALGLPDDKLRRLRELLAKDKNVPLVIEAASQQGDALKQAEQETIARHRSTAIHAEIQALLGDKNALKVREYQRSLKHKGMLDCIQDRLSYRAEILSPEQLSALVDIFNKDPRLARYASAPRENANADEFVGFLEERSEHSRRLLERMGERLTEKQRFAIAEWLDEQMEPARIMLERARKKTDQ